MVATLRPMTYEDVQDMPQDGQRYEIIYGELIVTPPPTRNHQRVRFELAYRLRDYARHTGAGDLDSAPCDVILGRFDVVQPDLMFMLAAHPDSDDNRPKLVPPDLIVEISSPFSRRIVHVKKMALYAHYGVPEYWIADPDRRTLTINILDGKAYTALDADANGMLESRVLPDLRIDPAEIFARLDCRD